LYCFFLRFQRFLPPNNARRIHAEGPAVAGLTLKSQNAQNLNESMMKNFVLFFSAFSALSASGLPELLRK
jgi:hypothetical protein